jgi:glutaminase
MTNERSTRPATRPAPVSAATDELRAFTDLTALVNDIAGEIHPMLGQGHVADHIPALSNIPADRFGMALRTVEGGLHQTGDTSEPFSIQSISKLFTLTLALQLEGEALWSRVRREPTSSPFNSLGQLEQNRGIPTNPFVNAGALVLVDAIISQIDNADAYVLEFVRALSGNPNIGYNAGVARSEREHGHRNAALGHLLRSFGNLNAEVDDVLEAYFRFCSIEMSCIDLAQAFQYLAQRGRNPITSEVILSHSLTKRTNALLLTCGVYDAVGDFAYRVGLPAKSGIGGGIVAVMPGQWCVAVWSPGLNEAGNSLAGTLALEQLTTKTGTSVF